MAKQKALPGILSPKIQAVHDAAVSLLEIEGKHIILRDLVKGFRDTLVKEMKRAGLTKYSHAGIVCELREDLQQKVKVRMVEGEKIERAPKPKKGKKK